MTASASRRFELVRSEDISGVSGTGVVAAGVRFANGTRAEYVAWLGLGTPEPEPATLEQRVAELERRVSALEATR